MEVIYDLDTEARAVCEELGIRMVRAGTVGTHPAIIRMIAELIETRTGRLRRYLLSGASAAGRSSGRLRASTGRVAWLRA